MAKKNCVHIMGEMDRIIEEKEGRLFFTIKIRKNENKFVYPIIEISTERYPNWVELQKGKMVIIEGSVKTEFKEIIVNCQKCRKQHEERYVYTTIIAQKMFIVDTSLEESYINKVMLLGTVCKEQEFKYIKSTHSIVSNMKYQLAINRREPNTSDYPWISTFARQADEDVKRLNVGSQIMVEGVLNTRYATKEVHCDCGETISIKKPQTEILGTAVEYLNNCKFDKENAEKPIRNEEIVNTKKLNSIFMIIENLFKNNKIKKSS